MILNIALRDLRSLFSSPLAWIILAVITLISAWKFLNLIDVFFGLQPKLINIENTIGVTDIVVANLFYESALKIIWIIPLLSMKSLSEENRSGSLQLLMSSPVSMSEIILGKYLALLIFIAITVFTISLMPLSLLIGSQIDMGKMLAGLLGLSLLLFSAAAIGIYFSSLTRTPLIAAISTYGVISMLWLIGVSTSTDSNNLFSYLSLLNHSINMYRGIISSHDVIYYVLLIITFITLSIHHMDAQRLQK
jgi:gliding motility-associated transport system permease protein